MTFNSKGPVLNDAERKSVAVGYQIHREVIAEGKRDSERFGYQVWANLDHELIGSGKCPFVKWDERSKKVTRTFSKELAAKIRDHVDDLKVYFAYVKACDRI